MARSIPVLILVCMAATLAAMAAGHPNHHQDRHTPGQVAAVKDWARQLGRRLTDMANTVTRYQRLQDNYAKKPIEPRHHSEILNTVARRLQKMMKRRVEQVQRIREAAEAMSVDTAELDQMPLPQPYLGVKDIETTMATVTGTRDPNKPKKPKTSLWQKLFPPTTTVPPSTTPAPTPPTTTLKPWLTSVDSFPAGDLINTSFSAVHIPANIYDGRWINISVDAMEYNSTGAQVQRVIELTEELDDVFQDNWDKDKTTSWQYFAHHTGVMRQYPASKWNRFYHQDHYDARVRPWYLLAAMSPKDVVILLDNSGSIWFKTPSRISKQVVHDILNTLGPDDFVSVLLFNNTVLPLLPGLNVSLIPATPTYVREMQQALDGATPMGEANLTLALETAFLLLEKYRTDDAIGASCNQAVMLVTDLVPEHYEDLFRKYNRPRGNEPGTYARVFPFIIQDWQHETAWKARWMACANQGWYSDIWKGEDDEVLNYVPVMARPIMLAAQHPVHWSHMYADVTVPGMTDKLWSTMQNDEQLRKVTPFCFKHAEIVQDLAVHEVAAQRHRLQRLPIEKIELGQSEEYVITVSTAARNMSAAGLAHGDMLGVAGIDIPVSEIKRRIPYHLVGVNAYVFMVTNNGFIVFHPDLRPRFNGILKPGFNGVDMVDIELEDYPFPRSMSDSMRGLRERVVKQTEGYMTLDMIRTYHNWNRVSAKASRQYWFRGVDNSPYSLVLATPKNYTSHRIKATPDKAISYAKLKPLLGKSNNWDVHPNWRYCGYCCGVAGRPSLELLGRHPERGGCAADGDDQGPGEQGHHGSGHGYGYGYGHGHGRAKGRANKKPDEDAEDENELAAALSADAETTRFWNELIKDWEVWDRWEASIAFVSTHSGLTRWLARRKNEASAEHRPVTFGETKGPEEEWYRRAVEEGMLHHADAPHWVVSAHLADEDSADVYSEYTASYNQDDPYATRRAGLADSWTGVPGPNLTTSGTSETAEEVGGREVTMAAMVTARPKSERVPAAVVGLRLPQKKLNQLFKNITSTLASSCPGQGTSCPETCRSDSLNCYLLDENAIVVADDTGLEAGRPLARVNPDLLLRLELAKVYTRITVNDHQGICRRPPPSTATSVTPSSGTCMAGAALAALWWKQGQSSLSGSVVSAVAVLLGGAQTMGQTVAPTKPKDPWSTASPRDIRAALAPLRVNKTILHMCVMLRDLHRVGPGVQSPDSPSLPPHHPRLSCDDTPFVAVSVPGTSLVLVVARKGCPAQKTTHPVRTEPYEDVISAENPVVRKEGLLWPRRRPGSCFREHIDERNITECSAATRTAGAAAPLTALLAVALAVALTAVPPPA